MNTKNELKAFFENGKVPNQEQFWAWMDSYWHKEEVLDPGAMLYTSENPTVYQVGGIPVGIRLKEMPVTEVLDFILNGKKWYELTITTSPEGAAVSIDNGSDGGLGNPSMTAYDGEVLYYRVNAPGYIEKKGSVKVTDNMTIHVTLDPEPSNP
ncbi:PEGA domain-containing protein [Chryseobacterium sp. KMC2]|uniref:PEGA domain-containing protein n=1 Tax=Chryseobacterium sp. KMC2 TaxID=2800705 RepID=UPI001922B422|nr:PEGA domain-containing protein [Chryseobacterium sp. KMC2]MBL3545953.1 PEGA domain-containing protein [Chryseobacterium sp. KMC2]